MWGLLGQAPPPPGWQAARFEPSPGTRPRISQGHDERHDMRTFLAAAAILAGFSFGVMHAIPADAQPRDAYVACPTEDSTDCVWDARHQGNGMGQSFWVGEGGKVYPLPHHIAHYLLGLPTQPR